MKTLLFFSIVLVISCAFSIFVLLNIIISAPPIQPSFLKASSNASLECRDHIDNNGNGYCDFISKEGYCKDGSILGDPNCKSKWDVETVVCVPSVEVCDDFDNDCDGKTDEDLIQTRSCGTDVGECEYGAQTRECYAGGWGAWSSCSGGKVPKREKCGDLKDNDCDDEIDEGCGASFPF